MKTTLRIAAAELRYLFCSPVAWLILVIFSVQVDTQDTCQDQRHIGVLDRASTEDGDDEQGKNQYQVINQYRKILAQNDLPVVDGRREKQFDGTATIFTAHERHGEQRYIKV